MTKNNNNQEVKIRKLSNIAQVDPGQYETHKPGEFLNQPLILNDFTWEDGRFDQPYVVMKVKVTRTGEMVTITASHKPIIDILSQLEYPIDSPIAFQFKRLGKTILMQ